MKLFFLAVITQSFLLIIKINFSLEQSESSPSFPQISTTTRSHLLGSPCPAISSWPAPPPRVELKPTAIAAPLSTSAFSTSSPSTSLRPAPTIVPLSQYTLHHSPIPNLLGATSPHSITPLPRLELPLSEGQESGNSTHLLTMLRAIANGSAPPGAG
ncbi:hypothetical protein ACQ4LE_004987 [Meloidogyne hapla]